MDKNLGPVMAVGIAVAASRQPQAGSGALDKAFDALNAYDNGSGRGALLLIDEAVRTSMDDEKARLDLARRLAAVLQSRASIVAKEYVCRQLGLIGSDESAQILGQLLDDKELAGAARGALETMPGRAATKALWDHLPGLGGLLKIGVINSLGMRHDASCVAALARLLEDENSSVAGAAAAALGRIGTVDAGKALRKLKLDAKARPAMADACLASAEKLLAGGKRKEAAALYQELDNAGQPKHVRSAAARGKAAAEGTTPVLKSKS